MPPDTLKCYEVLGVEPGASAERIRKAYVDLALTWDPSSHEKNPILRAETEKRRHEIDEAYRSIRFFLPELQKLHEQIEETPRFTRDFRELSVGPKVERSKAVLGLLAALVLASVAALSYSLYRYGKSVTPASPQFTPVAED